MNPSGQQSITGLLVRWSNGEQAALDELMPLVYDELRRLAGVYLRREMNHHSMQPTMLVHEAWLRFINQQQVSFQNRNQFFALAAQVIRHLLVDHARAQLAEKRGGDRLRVSISQADRFQPEEDLEILALDDALNDLAESYPEHSKVIELRFFGGLTIEETASALGVSDSKIERQWNFARAWLRRQLSR